MERSSDRLFSDLREGGILIPPSVSSIETLTTQDLFSICAQCVNRIVGSDSFDLVRPEPVVGKVETCEELAVAIGQLGLIGEMTFDKLLYPSEEDTRELLRFLAGRLADKSSVTWEAADVQNVGSKKIKAEEKLEKLSLSGEEVESLGTDYIALSIDKLYGIDAYETVATGRRQDEVEELTEESQNEKTALVCLQSELDRLKEAIEMALYGETSSDSILEELQEKINDKKIKLSELELQWNALKAALELKKGSLEESIYSTRPEFTEKFRDLKQVELELDTITNEVRRKDREHGDLLVKLKKQQKRESRRSYIQRIEELTKNSRKQETDVERILREIRELQLESNVIQERLHRTYAVLDEIVFREAKKDQVGRQAYQLLTSMHESFEQVSDKMLSTDRVQREITDHKRKLAAMASRSINMEALQADIDAITKENEHLTKRLENGK